MLGTFDLAKILDHAADARAKVVLVGDPGQLPKFDAGGCFRALAAQPGAVALQQDRRQRHEHDREKVDLLRAGRPEAALAVAAKHGDVIVADSREDVIARMVHDYCQALGSEPNSVMIAARRSEVAELDAQARAIRDRDGHLGAWRVDIAGTEFAVGDRVIIKRNERRLGIQNGNRGSVTAVDAERTAITVELADRRRVVLDAALLERPGRHRQPSLVHGYAATAHVMQGQTTERAFVLGSEGIYREWGYVAMTARESGRCSTCATARHLRSWNARARNSRHMTLRSGRRWLISRASSSPRSSARLRSASSTTQGGGTAHDRAARGGAWTGTGIAQRGRAQARASTRAPRRDSDSKAARSRSGRSSRGGRAPYEEADRRPLRAARRHPLRRGWLAMGGIPSRRSRAAASSRRRDRGAGADADARLRHVEPPAYVVDTLGARPDGPSARHVWDHGLRVIKRYRARHGVNDRFRPLGSHPINRDASQWLIANRELQRTARTLGRDAEPERDRTVTDRLL